MASPSEQPPTVQPPPVQHGPVGKEQLLTEFVGRRVASLQRGYLSDASTETKTLAELRRPGAQVGPGLPLWLNVLDGLPQPLVGRSDDPSRAERSALAALQMYAVHQQSRGTPMHVPGHAVGSALRALASVKNSDGVLRRFHALGSAEYWSGTVTHLRGLVGQLRAAGVPLDYGRLARDLYRLQHPVLAPSVRLDWARQYHRAGSSEHNSTTSTETTEQQPANGAETA